MRLIGLALFIWVLFQVDLPSIFAIIGQADPLLLACGILLAAPTVLVRAWRHRRILQSFGVSISMSQALVVKLVGTAAGDMLPGRTGEMISVAYLQKAGYGLRDPALTLILDRMFDFVILAAWAIASLWIMRQQLQQQIGSLQAILLIFFLGFSIAIALLLIIRAHPGLLKRFLPQTLYNRLIDALGSQGNVDSKSTNTTTFKWNYIILLQVIGASLLSFIFLILRGYLLARSINIELSIQFLAACMAITTLLQLIPVSNVLGVGTREVSLVYLFGLAGISAELAVSFSFLIMLALLAQDLVGLILWLRYPVNTPFLMKRES